ncbi:hypothetical protein [Actinomadura terrae]|uniref:hypothetical protein n=1 Tax=Actinomadura terrae TaxID=604353 RepID=UPI001FA6F27B|nr:hypothetical protein [Actinomadura terrae]
MTRPAIAAANLGIYRPAAASGKDTVNDMNPTNLMRAGSSAVLAAAPLVAATSAVAATPVGHTVATKALCPAGNVCVYPHNDSSGIPTKYYRYGTYNLRNQTGCAWASTTRPAARPCGSAAATTAGSAAPASAAAVTTRT